MRAISYNTCILYIFFTLTLVEFSYQYRTYSVEDEDLCSPITKRKIKLGKGDKAALRIYQTRLHDHPIEWRSNFICKFEVQSAYKGGGVIAVIQYLNFRNNSEGCIDYVLFKGKDGNTSIKYCGIISGNEVMNSETDKDKPISSNALIDSKGELDVFIYVAKEPVLDSKTDIEIVFTSYKMDCSEKQDRNLRPCHEAQKTICIDNEFVGDKYLNCPYAGCVDEERCLGRYDPSPPDGHEPHPPGHHPASGQSLGNKVLIGSVSTLFILFGVFILCVWACKKHKIFCWSEDFAHPSQTPQGESNRNSRVIEMNDQTGARVTPGNEAAPSAPIEEDKDLPPSYDSLFPESTTNR